MKKHIMLWTGLLLCTGILTLVSCEDDESGVWTDAATGLTWQLENKDEGKDGFLGIIPIEARQYCQDLDLGGYDDWRLPTYAELQTIVAGNDRVAPGGECRTGLPGAGTKDGKTAACAATGEGGDFGGPGKGGCYWKDGLAGSCSRIDPFGTHPYETLTADVAADHPEDWVAFITFATGAAGYNHACSLGEVRCVRSDTPVPECMVNGRPCHTWYRSKQYCDQDLTAGADTLRVTINLPSDPVVNPPYQLMGFLYRADPEWFPPLGPPDGGTDYNQIFLGEPGSPKIDGTTPYTMDIPGTTYYREALLEGDFQLFIELQLVNTFPPIPVAGDFFYGPGQIPVSFPFNGDRHTGAVREISVDLDVVGCPADKPASCPDGSCAKDADSCPVAALCPDDSSCFPGCPDDSAIFTCLYENAFDGGSIAMVDYPASEGWNKGNALSNCEGILGAGKPVIVQGKGQSALVQIGGTSAGRCRFTDDGRLSYAQDIGSTFCTLGGGDWEAGGPWCTPY